MNTSLKEKVAVVTGATSGIGAAIARRLGADGASLVLTGRNTQRADELKAELRDAAVEVDFVIGDVRSEKFVTDLRRTVIERHGRLDVLVLNAGVISWGPTVKITPQQFDDMMATNVRAPWSCVRALHDLLVDGATIVATSSVSAWSLFPGEGVYGMGKAAVVQMVNALAVELADRNIRVNALCPGAVAGGGMTQHLVDASEDPEAMVKEIEDLTPLRRIGTLEEIAAAAAYLASDASSFITGHALAVDGGQMIPRL